jgi:pilus assembly protein CpaB
VNPRQRRGVLLLLLAAVGAVVVFFSVSNYVSDVRTMVGPDLAVLELTTEATAWERITPDMYVVETVPERFIPDGVVTEEDVFSLVPSTDLPAGTILQEGLLSTPIQLNADESEIAITVDVETGVGGNIRSGDYVDIYATFEANEAGRPDCQTRLITDALILGVGVVQRETELDPEGSPTEHEVVPVRFALDYLETKRLVYAEDFASRVRLAKVSPDRAVNLQSGTDQTLLPETCRVPLGIFEEGQKP